jgi:hypothetical protein
VLIHIKGLIIILPSTWSVTASFVPQNSETNSPQTTNHRCKASSPLSGSHQAAFADKITTSGLNPATVQMLDWMSFLTAQTRSSALNYPSEVRYAQIMLSATCIYARLSELPPAHDPLHPAAVDFIYEAVRLASLASLVYSNAILRHVKLSQSCGPDAISALLEATSRISLQKWEEMPGIWLFILLVANAGARFTREGRLSRALMRICPFSIALRDWQALVNLMESFLAVRKWIAERGGGELVN